MRSVSSRLHGVVLGLVLSIGLAGALRGSLRVCEPMIFLSAAGILLAVVMVAAYLPARRASHTDPGVILRQN
jgi:hypothetical protein